MKIVAVLAGVLVVYGHAAPTFAQPGGRPSREVDPAAIETLLRQSTAVHEAMWSVIDAIESAAPGDLAAEELLMRVATRLGGRLNQQSHRTAGNQPEFDLWAGMQFLREGPVDRAVRHLGRAVVTGPFGLDPAMRRRAAVGLAEALLWSGDPIAAMDPLRVALDELPADAPPHEVAMVAIPLAAAQRAGALDEEAQATLAGALRRIEASAAPAAADAVASLRRAEAEGFVTSRRFDAAIGVLRDEIEVAGGHDDGPRQLRARIALVGALERAGRQPEASAERTTVLGAIAAMQPSDEVLAEESTIALLVASEEWALARPLIAPAIRQLSVPDATGPQRARMARLVAAVMRGTGRNAEADRWSRVAERLAPEKRDGGSPSGRRP